LLQLKTPRPLKYIQKKEAQFLFQTAVEVIKETLENAGVRLSHHLAHENDPARIHVIITKEIRRAVYEMKATLKVLALEQRGASDDEIKSALAKVRAAPVGKESAARIYNELLRAISYGLFEITDIKAPGKYDSPFTHGDIVYDVYSLFCDLRRTLMEAAPVNRDLLPIFVGELKRLQNEITKRIVGDKSNIGDAYKSLRKSGARILMPGKICK